MTIFYQTLGLLILLVSPVWAWNDPWTDCGLWGNSPAEISSCRKHKIMPRWEQKRLLEKQEIPLVKQPPKQTPGSYE